MVKTRNYIWDKVFKSGLSKFFKGCLPQNLLSPLLNTFSVCATAQLIVCMLGNNQSIAVGSPIKAPNLNQQ